MQAKKPPIHRSKSGSISIAEQTDLVADEMIYQIRVPAIYLINALDLGDKTEVEFSPGAGISLDNDSAWKPGTTKKLRHDSRSTLLMQLAYLLAQEDNQ